MVEVLLRYGADPELANDAGELPLELAKKSLAGDTHESNIPKLQKIISMLEQAIAKKATTAQKGKKSGKKKKSKSKMKK
jgi:ankyrin repeat protein